LEKIMAELDDLCMKLCSLRVTAEKKFPGQPGCLERAPNFRRVQVSRIP
jgi:hypothetical protein